MEENTSTEKNNQILELFCGELKISIKYRDLSFDVSIYSDGYSTGDIINSKGEPEDNFDNPISWDEIVNKTEKYKERIELAKKKGYECLEQDFEQFISNLPENISLFKHHLRETLKNFNQSVEIEKVEFFEPPLTFERKNERKNHSFKRYLTISKEKAIKIELTGQKPQAIIRLGENKTYHVIVKKQDSKNVSFSLQVSPFGDSPRGIIKPYKGDEKGWTINFLNNLFYGFIVIYEGENPIFKIPIYILPEKISPEDVKSIVEDILTLHSQLIFDYSESTGLFVLSGEFERRNPIQVLKYILYIWEKRKLGQILQSIIDNPNKVLITEEILKDISESSSLSPYRIVDMISFEYIRKVPSSESTAHFSYANHRYKFTSIYDEQSRILYDTYPNRFVKFFLKFIINSLNWALGEIGKIYEEDGNYYMKFISYLIEEGEKACKNTVRFLSKDFFNEVSDLRHLSQPPLVLLKEERYSTVFRSYLEIINGIKTDEELEEMLRDPVKNMPELYEYWCFLNLKELLDKLWGKGEIEISEKLEKGSWLIEKWQVEYDRKGATLEYQRRFSRQSESRQSEFRSYSVPLRPDIFLRTHENIIVFDAKYRVKFVDEIEKIIKKASESSEGEREHDEIKEEERRGTFKLADLYKMHTYREAILVGEEAKRPIWVIALYPGDTVALFQEKGKAYIENISKVGEKKLEFESGGVGALPFKPSILKDKKIRDFLVDLLKSLQVYSFNNISNMKIQYG